MMSRRNDCMVELKYQVIFIYSIYVIMNVFEILMPAIRKFRAFFSKSYIKKLNDQNVKDEEILVEKVESEFMRQSYDDGEVNGTVEEYSELMIQFGFISLFSLGFPILVIIAFINNIFEMLIDKQKIMSLTRRPMPAVAKNNGIFTSIFTVIAFLCVFSNVGIMSFTGKTFGPEN